ncbi:response regulator transcription factor [Dehalogenimonas alkenigignens]|uniref:response regulator transcription factor n=1 Tax=Dehalogenimonas alkenigignens TaxID=1217799 RepID=UPI000D582053|nr:response regulator transcription factor [Dehalogenimonas alkenigignens]PVV83283.1 hypothetical protein DD509_06835 [Dehalogenimonas alkenigignens]
MKALVVDSQKNDVDIAVSALRIPWPDIEVVKCQEGKSGLEAISKDQFDLVIVDLDLTDMNGFDLLESIFLYISKPTIVLKQNLIKTDVVRCLQLGADECLAKPIDQMDFIAKTQAVIRRYIGRNEPNSLTVGKLRLDAEIHRAYINGHEIALTRNENILMHRLMLNYGHITSYSSIERAIWGAYLAGTDCALRGCLKRLKKKLALDPSLKIITEHGAGIRLVTPF